MDDRERLVGLIYEGVTNEEVWQELLALLGDQLNAAGTGLGLQDMATRIPGSRRGRHRSRPPRDLPPPGTGKPDLAGHRPRRPPDGRLDGDAQIRTAGLTRSIPSGSPRKASTVSGGVRLGFGGSNLSRRDPSTSQSNWSKILQDS
jgi:hypothetical protein